MNQTAQTKYGAVRGYIQDGIVKFHGIPYAQAGIPP